jgi:hypothetical protein
MGPCAGEFSLLNDALDSRLWNVSRSGYALLDVALFIYLVLIPGPRILKTNNTTCLEKFSVIRQR